MQWILRFLLAAAIDLAIGWIYFRVIHVNHTTVGFTFLLAILAVSRVLGLAGRHLHGHSGNAVL